MGPITLYDKSFLQSLSVNEALWFDHFFFSNTSPLFFIETLADLKKEYADGRNPEDEVRKIADKTPELSGGINWFHFNIYIQSLLGAKISLDLGQICAPPGKDVIVNGKTSTIFTQPPEFEALQRWQKGEFQFIEREIAAAWRQSLKARPNLENVIPKIHASGLDIVNLKSIENVKDAVTQAIQGSTPFLNTLKLALYLQNVPDKYCNAIISRHFNAGQKPLAWFAPYAAFVFSVDLFYYISVYRGFISGDRGNNKIDLEYLYYLPFCMIFVSSDNLHRRCAPLFIRPNQKFVWGPDLKAGLREINAYYASLPDAEKEKGLFEMAPNPPDMPGIVPDLWRAFLPGYAKAKTPKKEVDPILREAVTKEIRDKIKRAMSAPPAPHQSTGKSDSVIIQRIARKRRGDWWQLPKDLKD